MDHGVEDKRWALIEIDAFGAPGYGYRLLTIGKFGRSARRLGSIASDAGGRGCLLDGFEELLRFGVANQRCHLLYEVEGKWLRHELNLWVRVSGGVESLRNPHLYSLQKYNILQKNFTFAYVKYNKLLKNETISRSFATYHR